MTRLATLFLAVSIFAGFAWGLVHFASMPRLVYENGVHDACMNYRQAPQTIIFIHIDYPSGTMQTLDGQQIPVRTKQLEVNLIPAGAKSWL